MFAQNDENLKIHLFGIVFLLFFLKKLFLFFAPSVSVSDLQLHLELDPDSDGSFTEAEAQVCPNLRSR